MVTYIGFCWPLALNQCQFSTRNESSSPLQRTSPSPPDREKKPKIRTFIFPSKSVASAKMNLFALKTQQEMDIWSE
ncbi:hypothetical protein, partial [uncultured Roseobacter sp.]|uniref:hypothetical protein n=1 Tax=uncultured Roseobacter sp. TaxID=114847 RepID=UPI00262717F5